MTKNAFLDRILCLTEELDAFRREQGYLVDPDSTAARDLISLETEAVVRLSPGTSETAVIGALDRLLEPYGASGAYGREEQISDAFISSELDQLRTMGSVLPPIFLLVAAFLVNVVISRLIATERAEIGLMKAFGYSDLDVAAQQAAMK